jgi:hypothetical protein
MHTHKNRQKKNLKNFQKSSRTKKVQNSEGLDLAFAFPEQSIYFEILIFLLKKKQ